ncbi:HAMP domain-containing sensor histidine kinase [Ottowia sp.]|uniref:HAMP domain-containing sensor histidine kinase n=1 Tax=Ottowia sp. TaxID=1898956 RepID=UPI003A8C6646
MTDSVAMTSPRVGWWQRARHSLRVRLVLLFLLLALAMTAVFLMGMGRAFSGGWRDTVSPLIADYAGRLVTEIGSPPSIERAQAIVQRLPVVVRIDGPQVQWTSGPWPQRGPPWARTELRAGRGAVVRQTADGHRIGITLDSRAAAQAEPGPIIWATLAALLGLTALAYALIHRMLRPIRAIGAGVRRFGAGQFELPIETPGTASGKPRPDELNDLARAVNQMAADIRQMLDAKRSLLLAISHELRSPLTRARLNAELLHGDTNVQPMRDALLRDLGEMRDLIADLLEGERLSSAHAALQREPTDVPALAREVIGSLIATRGPATAAPTLQIDPALAATLALDATRVRLVLRNLLDNALRHTPVGAPPPELRLTALPAGGVTIEVRDHGPGVPPEQIAHLSEAFYRPDSARLRASGGVGLGLYLVRLVAQAHGGRWQVRLAQPGLAVQVELPENLQTPT